MGAWPTRVGTAHGLGSNLPLRQPPAAAHKLCSFVRDRGLRVSMAAWHHVSTPMNSPPSQASLRGPAHATHPASSHVSSMAVPPVGGPHHLACPISPPHRHRRRYHTAPVYYLTSAPRPALPVAPHRHLHHPPGGIQRLWHRTIHHLHFAFASSRNGHRTGGAGIQPVPPRAERGWVWG